MGFLVLNFNSALEFCIRWSFSYLDVPLVQLSISLSSTIECPLWVSYPSVQSPSISLIFTSIINSLHVSALPSNKKTAALLSGTSGHHIVQTSAKGLRKPSTYSNSPERPLFIAWFVCTFHSPLECEDWSPLYPDGLVCQHFSIAAFIGSLLNSYLRC